MKKFFFTFTFVSVVAGLFAQKVAIIGVNEDQPDGFSFVVLEAIEAGTRIYFTTEEYQSGTCAFGEISEEVAYWDAPAGGMMVGEVVFIKESEVTPNTFELACSNGMGTDVCGAFAVVTGNFNIGTQDELYLFRDDDNDVTNGVDEIYCVLYHDHRTTDVNALPAANDPRGDDPCGANTIVVDELNDLGAESGHFQYTGPRTLPIFRNNLEDPAYYTHGPGSVDLDVAPFTGVSPAIEQQANVGNRMAIYPNPVSNELTITFDVSLRADAAIEIYDTQGHLLRRQQVTTPGRGMNISLDRWPAGAYLLRLVSEEGIFATRFIKN